MRIECPGCSASNDIRPSEVRRKARCKECDGWIVVPAEGEDSAADDPEHAEDHDRMPIPAIAASVVSFLVAILFVPVALFTAGIQASGDDEFDLMLLASFVFLAFGAFAIGFVAGGIGLWLRKTWGWLALSLLHGFFLLLNLKMMTPLLNINFEHPQALDAAMPHLLLHGIPTATSLLVLILLMLPKMRLAYGIKEQPYVRRRGRRVRT